MRTENYPAVAPNSITPHFRLSFSVKDEGAKTTSISITFD
jgi:hypothetical protein